MAITVTRGKANCLVDGVTVKHLGNMTFYYLDDLMLLQVEVKDDGFNITKEVVIKSQFLSKEEKDILDRLLDRLDLRNYII